MVKGEQGNGKPITSRVQADSKPIVSRKQADGKGGARG